MTEPFHRCRLSVPVSYTHLDVYKRQTVASEVMAVLCLASDISDLKERLARIIVAYTYDGKPVTAKDLRAEGAMAALLKDALKPNLVQTIEAVSYTHLDVYKRQP